MAVKIPVNLVPRAYVDFDMEQQQILGHAFRLSDGFRVPPLTAARLMALELVCSDFFLHPGTCTQLDVAAALVLMSCERNLVEELTSAALPGTPVDDAARVADNPSTGAACGLHGLSAFPDLYAAAAAFLNAHGDAMVADYPRLVRWCIEVPFYGFDMIPKTPGGQPSECWFDGAFAGSVIAPAAKILATPVDTVLWDTPLCLVWHAIAQHAAAYGVKHVERPPDQAVLKSMMKDAAEREKRGELHPWQYADPLSYGLTDAQAQANPALIGVFAEMRVAFEKNGHKPLDPADYPLPEKPSASEAERDPEYCPPLCVSVPLDGRDVRSTIAVSTCASEAERTAQVESSASDPGFAVAGFVGDAARVADNSSAGSACCLPGMRATISNQDIFING